MTAQVTGSKKFTWNWLPMSKEGRFHTVHLCVLNQTNQQQIEMNENANRSLNPDIIAFLNKTHKHFMFSVTHTFILLLKWPASPIEVHLRQCDCVSSLLKYLRCFCVSVHCWGVPWAHECVTVHSYALLTFSYETLRRHYMLHYSRIFAETPWNLSHMQVCTCTL